jgi:hypothetical protein
MTDHNKPAKSDEGLPTSGHLRHDDLIIPSYRIHPLDAPLVRLAAREVGMSLVDFAQLAPYLLARKIFRTNESDSSSSA